MDKKKQIDFIEGIKAIAEEKNLKVESVVAALEKGIITGFRKDQGLREKEIDIEVEINIEPAKGENPVRIFKYLNVVEEVKDPDAEISVEDANKDLEEGDEPFKVGDDDYSLEYTPENFGRIASQAVKNILNSGIREEENQYIYDLYKDRVGELLFGTVQRVAGPTVYITIEPGDVEAVLPKDDRVFSERMMRGDKLHFLVKEVENKPKGVLIILTRRDPEFIVKLFEREVPEMTEGIVKIEKIVRIEGEKTKLMVSSNDPNVEAVGTLIGTRGNRIKIVMEEIYNERIDVIPFSESKEEIIRNSLAPAKVELIEINDDDENAVVVVADASIGMAIGSFGINLKLTSELIGKNIDIYKHSDYFEDEAEEAEAETVNEDNESVDNDDVSEDQNSLEDKEESDDNSSEEKNDTEENSETEDNNESNKVDETKNSEEKNEEEKADDSTEVSTEDKE